MTEEIKVPVLPESVSDATVATWHKQPGDKVARDENIVDIETDKVILEVVAPSDGTLSEILKPTGSTVTANEVIGKFTVGEVAATSTSEKVVASNSEDINQFSPAVKRLVQQHDIDINMVTGTGKNGRVIKQDIENYLKQSQTNPEEAKPIISTDKLERRVPMTRLRAKIAERLLEAQKNAAILTTFNEVDLSKVIQLRSEYKDKFEKQYGVRLGFMSFFVRAAIEALKQFPAVNASIDGDDIVYHGYFDIGVAVSSPRGLVVPVIRNANQLSMAEIEKTIKDFGEKAQQGKLSIEEMTGGTFTISNGGVFGSLLSTPILNPPQSGILGMHKIQERPIVESGEIKICPMMYVALSYDHRIIDGRESVQFLVTIKEMLEQPARLILEI